MMLKECFYAFLAKFLGNAIQSHNNLQKSGNADSVTAPTAASALYNGTRKEPCNDPFEVRQRCPHLTIRPANNPANSAVECRMAVEGASCVARPLPTFPYPNVAQWQGRSPKFGPFCGGIVVGYTS